MDGDVKIELTQKRGVNLPQRCSPLGVRGKKNFAEKDRGRFHPFLGRKRQNPDGARRLALQSSRDRWEGSGGEKKEGKDITGRKSTQEGRTRNP